MKKKIKRIFVCLLMVFLLGIISISIYWYLYYVRPAEEAIAASTAENFHQTQNSIIYDVNNEILCNLSNDKNTKYISYDDIPKNVVDGFIAVEDRNFWIHKGFDLRGIARVLVGYVQRGEKHGASTITQQVVKNTFLNSERTIDRKAKELAYAIALEQKYSKEDIMEFYVNNIYFGNQQYGIESAAEYYYQKSTKELNLAELTYIMAIPNAPTYYDPVSHPDHTKERQKKILKNMRQLEMITESEYQKAINQKVSLNVVKRDEYQGDLSTYAIYCATIELMKESGFKFQYEFTDMSAYKKYRKKYNQAYEIAKEKLYSNGYRIYTSLDPKKQEKLQDSIDQVLSKNIEKVNGSYDLQGAGTLIDNRTGNVIAIVGGRSSTQTVTLNRAFEIKRQPGSAIKPILVYAPAFDCGYRENSILQSVSIRGYSKGDSGTNISLDQALITSDNGAAYWLSNKVGIKRCLNYLKKMKFGSIVGEDETLSSSLGGLTIGTNTVEMASAYYCLQHYGKYKAPTCILKMQDSNGTDIYFQEAEKQIYDPMSAQKITELMEKVITEGTAKKMHWNSQMFAAGKTGTTNDSKDGWFCGFTKENTAAIWVGYDSNKSDKKIYGATYPAKIWKKLMQD